MRVFTRHVLTPQAYHHLAPNCWSLPNAPLQNLLADLNPEAHEFGKKVMADKKVIEARRCWCQSWLVTLVVNWRHTLVIIQLMTDSSFYRSGSCQINKDVQWVYLSHLPRTRAKMAKGHEILLVKYTCQGLPLDGANGTGGSAEAVRWGGWTSQERSGTPWEGAVSLGCASCFFSAKRNRNQNKRKSHVARPCQTPTGGIIWPFPGHAIVPWNVPRQYKKQRATSRSCSRGDIVVLEGFGASFLCVIDLSISGSSCNDHVNSLL